MIIRKETKDIEDWLTDISFETLDGNISVMTVIPGFSFKTLNKMIDSNQIANEYLERVPEYYFSNEYKILPAWSVTKYNLTRRKAIFRFQRFVLFGFFKTRWHMV
jgi:hypothetical protein